MIGMPIPATGILAIGVAVAVASAYGLGRHHGHGACELAQQAALAKSLQRGLDQALEIARQDAEITEAYEVERVRYITKLQTVVKEVESNVQAACTGCGLNPDGLRQLNTIRQRGQTPADPGQPHGGVPTPQTFGDGALPGTRGLPGAGQPHVLRLRGETQGPGQSGRSAGAV